jgi:hypothetical protein
MKILMEDVLDQFNDNKGIKKYLETGPTEMYDTEDEPKKKKKLTKKEADFLKGKEEALALAKSQKKADDIEEPEEDEKEPIENYVFDCIDEVEAAMMKIYKPVAKSIEKAADMALKKFCKEHKIDKDEMFQTVQYFMLQDEDEAGGLVGLYFKGM